MNTPALVAPRIEALREVCELILGSFGEKVDYDHVYSGADQAKLDILADLERKIGRLVDVPDVQKVKRD